jgi:hypothetical protein
VRQARNRGSGSCVFPEFDKVDSDQLIFEGGEEQNAQKPLNVAAVCQK